MVKSYQESNVPKKNLLQNLIWPEKKPERKSTKIEIFADLYC